MRPREIRELIQQTFTSLRSAPQKLTRETLLIREGHYCGHRYESNDLSAVWFLEEDQVKIFAKDGHLVLVLQASHPLAEQRRAA